MYRRAACDELVSRLREPRRFIQVLLGPRQTGKTTLARQARKLLAGPSHYASADEPSLQSLTWLHQQWEQARQLARGADRAGQAFLFLDEVHKIPGWADGVKAQWDQDTEAGLQLRVVLLGSSPMLVSRGLGDSLAGRFEIIRVTHWAFSEMRDAFGWNIDQYVAFGGYPGSAPLVSDPQRWSYYVRDSLIETTLSRDVLLTARVDKPALLRRLFDLASAYSGSILSYTKMIGQLHDAGNTTTLAHYLDLLDGVGMVRGLDKYSGQVVRQRSSSPKLQVYNNALRTVRAPADPAQLRSNPAEWGHLCESAVGAHLVNGGMEAGIGVFYWRDRGREVDFVLSSSRGLAAIEVKSGRSPTALPGMGAFSAAFGPARRFLVGTGGIPFDEFLAIPPKRLLE